MLMQTNSTHLDLGCGEFPRNPYQCSRLLGLDTRSPNTMKLPAGVEYVQCNFAIDALPFDHQSLDSVSAFDVLEHIPRQLWHPDRGMIYPFIDLMSEVFRVLKPGGLFLATTPGYPHPSAFQDPTHVNFITLETADYFCEPNPLGRIYGFKGSFDILINRFCVAKNYYQRSLSPQEIWRRRWHRKLFAGGCSHIIWELRSCKTI